MKNPVSAFGELKMRRDAEFTEYVTGRMAAWRRVGYLLCQDWDRADDLVQGAITKLYVRWNRARAADHIDSYAHVMLVREYLGERRAQICTLHARGLSVYIFTGANVMPNAIAIFAHHLLFTGLTYSRRRA